MTLLKENNRNTKHEKQGRVLIDFELLTFEIYDDH